MKNIFNSQMTLTFASTVSSDIFDDKSFSLMTADGLKLSIHVKILNCSMKDAYEVIVSIDSERKRLMAQFEHYLNSIITVLENATGVSVSLKDIKNSSSVVFGDLTEIMGETVNDVGIYLDHQSHYYLVDNSKIQKIIYSSESFMECADYKTEYLNRKG